MGMAMNGRNAMSGLPSIRRRTTPLELPYPNLGKDELREKIGKKL